MRARAITSEPSGAPPSRPPARRLRLFVFVGERFAVHELPEAGRLLLGSDPSCSLPIADPSVAPRHAALSLGRLVEVEDLGGGVRVRDELLVPGVPREVAPGEMLQLGAARVLVDTRPSTPPRRLLPQEYFDFRIEEQCFRAEAKQLAFTVLHVALIGGTAQRELEDRLSRSLRLLDVIAWCAPGRYEVLLTDTGPAEAEGVIARLRAALSVGGTQVTIRSAAYPSAGRSADELLAAIRTGDVPGPRAPHTPLVWRGGVLSALEPLLERVSPSDVNVLILGETGVGKESFAQEVHRRSPRRDRPFVVLNCASIPEPLLESELFGHERGAFTGAQATKPGLLETADGGTVLLDEIGEMPHSVQSKLLRVIEERSVLRLGGLKPRAIDVRILAATNRDLEVEVEAGRFRRDLFFRLNGFSFNLPPLRERVHEIPALCTFFAEAAARRFGRHAAPPFAAETLEALCAYAWPGNVRELRNVVERAVLLSGGELVLPSHLPEGRLRTHFAARRPAAPPQRSTPPREEPALAEARPERAQLRDEVARFERERIVAALLQAAGNQTSAARLLGVSRRTLVKRIAEYGIPRPRK